MFGVLVLHCAKDESGCQLYRVLTDGNDDCKRVRSGVAKLDGCLWEDRIDSNLEYGMEGLKINCCSVGGCSEGVLNECSFTVKIQEKEKCKEVCDVGDQLGKVLPS